MQAAAKCVVGVDYPKPIVNHAEASRLNIERMRQIYQQLSRYRGLSKTILSLAPVFFFSNSIPLSTSVIVRFLGVLSFGLLLSVSFSLSFLPLYFNFVLFLLILCFLLSVLCAEYCLSIPTGLLAAVPSNHGEDVNVNGIRGVVVAPSPGKKRHGNGHGESLSQKPPSSAEKKG